MGSRRWANSLSACEPKVQLGVSEPAFHGHRTPANGHRPTVAVADRLNPPLFAAVRRRRVHARKRRNRSSCLEEIGRRRWMAGEFVSNGMDGYAAAVSPAPSAAHEWLAGKFQASTAVCLAHSGQSVRQSLVESRIAVCTSRDETASPTP